MYACLGKGFKVIVRHNFSARLTVGAGVAIPVTQPETRKLQQVCYHQANIRMRSHRLFQLDDNKSVTSCCNSGCQVRNVNKHFVYILNCEICKI